LWAHSPTVAYLQRGHTMAYELSASKVVGGTRPWHTFYRGAVVGLTYQHFNLGNDAVLGRANGMYLFTRFNIAGNKNTRLRFGMGTGIVHLSKTFDKAENHKNVTIGSHFNALVDFQLLFDQRITPNLYFNIGLSLTHYSNGAFKTPNLGLNLPAAAVGLVYKIKPTPTKPVYAKNEFECNRKFIFSVIGTIGRKEIYPPTGRGYFAGGLMFNATKTLGIKSGITLTVDLFNDRAIAAILKRDLPSEDFGYFKTVRPGIALGYDLWLGNLSFIFQAGYYPYTYYKGDGRIYSRLGWRYALPYGLIANLTLKTHFAKADNIELGIGYTLFNRKRVNCLK
jgi:hypothetical protein